MSYNKRPHIITTADVKYVSNVHEQMARDEVWMTEKGDEIPYRSLEDSHLTSIIYMLETKKTNRMCHKEGIIAEKLRRTTELGKVLYE